MKKLIVLIASMLLLGIGSLYAQTREVRGTVVDESGLGLPGVSVSVVGTTVGASTDMDGKWSLTVSDKDVLEFSFMGMVTQKIKVGKQKVINVTLKENRVMVDEVMVVGYGVQKKSSFTGSANVVKREQLVNTPTASLSKALQATSPGVQVSSSSGAAGSEATIRIRGVGSLTASSSPLWVVDGIVGAPRPHLEDIANMTVLKDAASCSIYGSRAANGVILVTTKSGKKGRTQFDFQAKYSISQAPKKVDMMNSAEYYQTSWRGIYDAMILAGKSHAQAVGIANANVEKIAGRNPFDKANPIDEKGNIVKDAKVMLDEDWYDIVNRTGVTQQYDLSANGGNENTKFYFSLGYFDSEGIMQPDFYSKYTGQVSVTNKVTDKLKVGFKANFKRSESNGLSSTTNGSSTAYAAYNFPNNVSLYELDKDFKVVKGEDGRPLYNFKNKISSDSNPIGLANLNDYNANSTSLFASFNLNYEIIKNLSFDTKLSARYYSSKSSKFETADHGDAKPVHGRSKKDMSELLKYVSSSTLTYDLRFDDVHHINALIGYEFESYNETSMSGTGKNYGFNYSDELSVAAKPSSVTSSTLDTRMIGMFSRLNYDYENKYYASLSLRRDGSSKFAPDNRWGTFYSVSGSWRASQEEFLSSYTWLDDLKVKVSYGSNGNAGIGSYLYMPLYSLTSNYNGSFGLVHSNLANPDLTWEKNIMTNVGIDFGVLGFLTGSLEWFTRESEDLLMSKPLPYSSGWSKRSENVGGMKNTGIEFSLNSVNMRSEDFTWTTNFNITHYTNEITELTQDRVIASGGKIWRVGQDAYTWFMRDYAGIDHNTGEPQWWKDVKDKDGKVIKKIKTKDVGSATKYELGSSLPDFFGGLTNTFTYKNFTFGLQLYFSVGSKIYDNLEQSTMRDGKKFGYQLNAKLLDAWRPDNKDSNIPRYFYNNQAKSNYTSSRFLHDGSYLRIKSINVAYNIPKEVLSVVGIQTARIFANIDNLYTFTNYEGIDPEQGVDGINGFSTIPNVRTYTVGLRIGF